MRRKLFLTFAALLASLAVHAATYYGFWACFIVLFAR